MHDTSLPRKSGALGRNNLVFINGTIGWVIEKYLGHERGLIQHKPSTQRNYRLYCDVVKREIGQFKIIDLTPVAIRAMRDSVAKKHKTSVADMCVMMVSALWKFAIEYERLPLGHNPAVGIFKLHKQKKITKRWSAEVIENSVRRQRLPCGSVFPYCFTRRSAKATW